eukprot:799531_1
MPSGSVCLYFGSLYHAAGQNMTDIPRLGASIQYCQPWIRPQENDLAAVIGRPQENDLACGTDWNSIPTKLKQMIGCSWHPEGGHTGMINGQEPLMFFNKNIKSKM